MTEHVQKTLNLAKIDPRLPELYQAAADYMGVERDKLMLVIMRPLMDQLASELALYDHSSNVDTIEAMEHAIAEIFPKPAEKPGGGVIWGKN